MLVGDSMNRNQFESILCVLQEGLPNKSRMYEVHGHKISKGRGYFVFKFEVAKTYCILILPLHELKRQFSNFIIDVFLLKYVHIS